MTFTALLEQPPAVINVGVRDFAVSVSEQGAKVVHVEWTPPRKVDPDIADLLGHLL